MATFDSGEGRQELTEPIQQRASEADEFFWRIFTENGLSIISWQDFAAWKEYVDGKINESQLSERAKLELQELSRTFGKYVVVEKKDDPKHLKEEQEKRERAKQANKIYRKVCSEAGLRVSFFHDFGSWSDYVEGRISDAEFYEKAKSEVQRLLIHSQTAAR